MEERYYLKSALACVRGYLMRTKKQDLVPRALIEKPLSEISNDEAEILLKAIQCCDMKLHYFKRSQRLLPRVSKVLGFLRGICFDSLLDVGSGRGVFLLPLLDEFKDVQVMSLDILEKRYNMLNDMSVGGISNLTVKCESICDMPYANKSCDVVTMLEVLEHIPSFESAIRAAVSIARSYVVVSVPSKADDNPEHIHLFTKESLTRAFARCGVERLSFSEVPDHLIMIARLGEV